MARIRLKNCRSYFYGAKSLLDKKPGLLPGRVSNSNFKFIPEMKREVSLALFQWLVSLFLELPADCKKSIQRCSHGRLMCTVCVREVDLISQVFDIQLKT